MRGSRRFALAAALVAVAGGGVFLFARVQQTKAPAYQRPPVHSLTGAVRKHAVGPGMAVVTDPMLAYDASHHGFAWWPDGKSVVYATRREGSEGWNAPFLWRIDLETGNRQLLVDAAEGSIFEVEVSPTGDQVLFQDSRHLRVLEVATGQTRVVPESFGSSGATWSPDGERIAFARFATNDEFGRQTPDKPGLWVWRVVGGELKRLVRYPEGLRSVDEGQMHAPSWSPDGHWIAYVWQKAERVSDDRGVLSYESEIWLIRPDGSERHRVAAINRAPDDPRLLSEQCWSPDSRRLVFVWTEAVGRPPEVARVERGVTTLDIYTGELTSLGPSDASKSTWLSRPRPTWSPNSEHVAFALLGAQTGELAPTEDIAVVSTEGGTVSPVTSNGDVANASPLWSPDGRGLLYLRQFRIGAVSTPPFSWRFELWLVKLAPAESEDAP